MGVLNNLPPRLRSGLTFSTMIYTLKKYRRKVLQLGAQEAAEKIGVQYSQLNRWENGSQRPKAESLDRIAAAYDCDFLHSRAGELFCLDWPSVFNEAIRAHQQTPLSADGGDSLTNE